MTVVSIDPPNPSSSEGTRRSSPGAGLGRSTLAVSSLNLLSRLTGLARVVAMTTALGATALGDTYQAANLSSNILFELLAGGVLSAALVPTFVGLIDRGRRREAAQLAGAILGIALVALAAVVAVALVFATEVMRVLTIGVGDAVLRAQQVELGTFLLWFFLPQVLLYAVGAVSTALLHADRRFVAAALAPVFNNLMVVAAMLGFWWMRSGPPSLDLSLVERLVLASGATGGVVVMSLVPLTALWRSGMRLRPRWDPREPQLAPLAVKGAWATGHLGLSQLFALASLIVANEVVGGVVAYQVAYTFFLLPYALLANPLTTTLYPRLSSAAATGRGETLAADLAWGVRMLAFVLIPASFVIAALARPVMEVVRLGNLDAAGADLIGTAVAGYMAGLMGFATFVMLTRASYALGDTRTPTMVNLVATLGGIAVLVIAAMTLHGTALLATLGISHALAMSAAAIGLARFLRRRIGSMGLTGPLIRDLTVGAMSGMVAWSAVMVIGIDTRLSATVSIVIGLGAAGAVYAVGQRLLRSEELRQLMALVGRR